ncbi:SDR family NAD(P)-dependent oxidoreductase, partial [Streptomyces sp. NPDC048362]|uniref:SDR family NAD(P)-dependent oxidoreductase n=1 Tax=Streptomyces sp. NPDC048362 TaxID=3365539 RepID=UPI003712A954
WLTGEALTPEYWYRNLRETVRFDKAVQALLAEQRFEVFVEVSPHPVLTLPVLDAAAVAGAPGVLVAGTLRRDEGGLARVFAAFAELWVRGVPVDWASVYAGHGGRPIELPTYPFQRQRYWLEPASPARVAVRAPGTDALWEALEERDLGSLSAELKVSPDALGEVLPALSGWRAERSAVLTADSWRYRIGWQPLAVPWAEEPSGRWLVVLPEGGAGDEVVDALELAGPAFVRVTVGGPGETREVLSKQLAATAEEHRLEGVLSLLAREERTHPQYGDLPGAVALTLALVQALGDAGIDAPLWCAVSGTAVLGAGERPGGPVQGAVTGLARTVAFEHPERWGGLLDLPGGGLDERAARRLRAVLATVRDEDQVAVRSTGVYGRRLLPAPVRAERAEWRPSGAVLVTGGTGAIGARLARRLVARGADRVVLVSRRGAEAPGAERLRAELGAAVTVVACDAADRRALESLLREHRPTAVVHSAGTLDDGVLDALTPERLAASLRVKLTVARNLHELTTDLELSAFVVFSSVTGVVGNPGQGNYAAANAALDALVADRRAAGLPGTAIAWGAWGSEEGAGGSGMLTSEAALRLRDRGLPTMAPRVAVTAVARALAEGDEQVLVADADWHRFRERSGFPGRALFERIPAATAAAVPTGSEGMPPGAAPGPEEGLADRLAPLPAGERLHRLTALVRAHAATVLRHADSSTVLPDQPFAALGFDSLTAVELRNRLAAATGLRLPATVLFDHPTPQAVARRLLTELARAAPEPFKQSEPTGSTVGATGPAFGAPGGSEDGPLAVVGMACRLPGGVNSPEELWELLAEGRDAVGEWPTDRGWDTDRLYDPDPDHPGTASTRNGAFLTDVAGFDAEFFGISPREAVAMDPQQRLLLETSWQALEDSEQDPAGLRGRRVGVFVGTNGQDYTGALDGARDVSEGHLLTGNTASVLSGRISYALGLEGPALTVDTACSSSLVALHLAAQALRRGECELALAGGVTVMSTPRLFVEFSRQRGLAPDGRCKAFSADADGTGWGEGVGLLVLQRLSDARAQGRRVLAVIRGTAVNQDGASNGLTAPHGPSQQRVIEAALADAGLDPSEVDAVEAHGTGTRLGDPIEAQALQAVYGRGRPADRPLWLGSLKSNLGHTQAAAGVAGVIKTVLAIRHGVLPRTLHVTEPTPQVDWSDGVVRLLTESRVWDGGGPRRAGVSSFGISGTNAHVIVEEAPEAEPSEVSGVRMLPLLLSGRGEAALRASAGRLADYLDERPETDLAELGCALALTRASLEHRAAVHGADRTALSEGLRRLAAGTPSAALTTGVARQGGRTAFLLPGQGSQRAGAGAELYRSEPVFADALDEVLTHLDVHLDRPLREVMFAGPGSVSAGLLDRTRYTQPALFALQTALVRLLRHRGVLPDLLIGHSIGELSAAHAAGVLDLADACALVTARGRLMDDLPAGGAMAAVEAEEAEVTAALAALAGEPVALAAVNGPRSCVLSGERAAVLRVAETFRARGRRVKRLAVGHAFHSALLEPMLPAFREVAAGLRYRPPVLPVISDLTGEPAGAAQLCDPDYWVRHARGTVRFVDGVRRLDAEGATAFVELGTGGVLTALVQECLPQLPGGSAVALLREGRPEEESVNAALARLHVQGVAVDWTAGRTVATGLDLPGYPFQHGRYWPQRAAIRPDTDRLRYRITWEPIATPPARELTGRWLLVAPQAAASAARDCAQALAGCGAEVRPLPLPADADRAGLAALLPGAADGILVLPGDESELLLLIQAVADAGLAAPLWCLTRGAAAAGGEPAGSPEQAGVWGLGRVAALEFPDRWGGLVDLPAEPRAADWSALGAVLAGPAGEDQLAIRATGLLGRRLRRSLVPARPHPNPNADGPLTGTVLITGGTGGLGAGLARRLARSGTRHLVLAGRRGPDAPGAAELAAELTGLGTRVTLAACDVRDRQALGRLLADLGADRVTAVVHAAGLTSDTPLLDCTPAGWAAECAAKAAGAEHLDALFADRELDAFVLFSSVSAAWGSCGQGPYAAANARLDALAARRRAHGLTATSVAWGPWAGAGMAQGETGGRLRALGLRPMAAETALDALDQALALDETDLVVAEVDWARFGLLFESARRSPLLADLIDESAPERPEPATDEREPAGAPLRRRLAPLDTAARRQLLVELVRTEAAAALGHAGSDRIAPGRPFREAGFDSLTAVDLRNRLVAACGLQLAVTTVFDHPSAAALGGYLLTELCDEPKTAAPAEVAEPAAPAAGTSSADEPLAIVGMACRFPGGVESPEELWRLVAEGTDAVGPLPEDRGWPLEALYSTDRDALGTFYTTAGGFLADAGAFDAEFFGISPREALAMDPQQRLLMQTAWEAVERAGIDPSALRGTDGGVFLGVAAQGYGSGPQDPSADVEGHLLSGTVTSVASGRIAYTLGLEGPAVTVETACSSSLVALHLAGQSLRSGECSLALVGGAAVMATPDAFVEFSRQGGLSPDGRCRSFAEDAEGTGWSEGVGVLLVERLADARRHGHPVLALVRGSAVNQDGASNGLTAPNGLAQQRVIRRALANAGLSAGEVDAVEAHGTGTRLGDPIEADALLATYGQDRPDGQPLWLGSLKSNIGHTQAAAGVAGVIKSVLALRHAVLPRTLHADRRSSRVSWSAGAVELLTEAREWRTEGRPRRIGVSAFGMSGTNAHAILEQAPDSLDAADTPVDGAPEPLPWLLSARGPAALRRQAARVLELVDADPGPSTDEIARTLAGGRAALPYRAALLGTDRGQLRGGLAALAAGLPSADVVEGWADGAGPVFVFPGQGSQWAGMAVELLDGSAEFFERMAACEAALAPYVDWSLTGLLRAGDPLERVDVVQPALWAVMVALAAVWRAHGVEPAAVVGHSQGEIAAAVVAGALSLEDGARVVALRSRALRSLEGLGGMVSVSAETDRVAELLRPYGDLTCVAAVNGPQAVVVAGAPEALTELLDACERQRVRARRIPVAYAAHSAQVAQVRTELAERLAGVEPRPCAVPLWSTVTGGPIDGELLDADYWYRNLREPVAFATATRGLLEAGHELFVEVSPHPVLIAAVDGTAQDAGRPAAAVGTLRRGDGGPWRLLGALAEAWTAGAPVAWRPGRPQRPDLLPTYPFARERYWLPTPGRGGQLSTAAVPAPVPAAAGDPTAELARRLDPLDQAERTRVLVDLVSAHAAATLGHATAAAIWPERAFADLGFDSMLAVRFRNRLSAATGLALPPTAVFDHPSPAALAALLERELNPEPRRPAEAELDRLAEALAGLDPTAPGTEGVGARLRELLDGWAGRAGVPTAAPLGAATADELFDLLDNDFGMAD